MVLVKYFPYSIRPKRLVDYKTVDESCQSLLGTLLWLTKDSLKEISLVAHASQANVLGTKHRIVSSPQLRALFLHLRRMIVRLSNAQVLCRFPSSALVPLLAG